jgi:hypothetical protein
MGVRRRLIAAGAGLALMAWLAGCAAPGLVGRWREADRPSTLEFRADGVFRAVDHQGMAVEGLYVREGEGGLRFEIRHPGASPEAIRCLVRVDGDVLTLVFPDSGETGIYRRVR